MKELKKKSLKILVISIALMIALSQVVFATDTLFQIQSNSTGTQSSTSDAQEIAPITAEFKQVNNETVYAIRDTNIKESYSSTSATLSTLSKDASITRTGINDTNGWSRVQLTNGTTGYIQTADLTTTAPTPSISFTTVEQTVYATQNTSVYSDYSNTLSSLTTLTKNSSVTRTGISSTGDWSRVRLANGTIGYVKTSDLTTNAPTVTTSPTVNQTVTKSEKEGSLPQTGIEDNPIMLVVIGGCIITAVFAYKKIKEYNV